MALPQDFLLELKYRNDIDSVLSPYIALKRRGSNLVGLCPFHNEKTPSFTVYPENGSYYCFGCGQGGDIITFTMKMENLDYIDAIRRLAEKAGLRMPEDNHDDKELKLKNDIYAVNAEAGRFFHSVLMSQQGKAGLDYFLGRGLSLKTVKRFGLGFAPDDWHALENHLKSKGFTDYIISAADLVGKSEKKDKFGKNITYDRFRNRIMFPIINIHGKVIGFSGRAMPGNEKQGGKYINTSDTPVYKKSHNMFALNYAKAVCSKQAILVEGNMDVIALHQAGFTTAVAALGTSFTEEQARLLGRYTKEVVLTMDADSAGEKATDRAISILEPVGVSIRVLRLPDCKDPDEFIKKHGNARFQKLLDNAMSALEYKLLTAARGIDLEGTDGKLKYLNKACEVLAATNDPIAIDLYTGKLSAKYGVSKERLSQIVKIAQDKRRNGEIKRELNEIIAPQTAKKDEINPQKAQFKLAAKAEETVISVLVRHPDMLETAKSKLDSSDFLTDFNRRLFERVVEILETGREFDLVLLGADFSPDEIGYITRLLTVSTANENATTVLEDSIKVILRERREADKPNVSEMNDDDWAKEMSELIKSKKKGKT